MSDELPRMGSGVRQLFKYDPETRSLVPVEERPKLVDAPYVHQDSIEPTMSHASHEGFKFTSKAKLRRHYRENGYIETGGEHLTMKPPKEDIEARKAELIDDVKKVVNDLRWGNIPVTERERETWNREQRELEAYKRRQR